MCDSQEATYTVKCMIVGDCRTGKTHLFKKFTDQELPTEYTPTVFDISELKVQSKKGCNLTLSLWDSAGSHVYDNIRPISYAHTDCFIVCYSIKAKNSYENVLRRWIPEIKEHGDGPNVPIILIATKYDTTDYSHETTSNADCVTESEGKEMQEKIGATSFYECSVLAEIFILEVLQAAIDLACVKKEDDDKPSDPIWKFCSPTVVFIGDSGVGKSSLLQACLKCNVEVVNHEGKQTEKLQEYYHNLATNGKEYFLRFMEIPCQSEYLITIIHQVDVLVLCYAIDDPFSFQTIEQILESKLKDQFKKIPKILVGTKSELKETSMCVIPTIDGELLKQKAECVSFLECSTKKLGNASEVLGAILENISDQS